MKFGNAFLTFSSHFTVSCASFTTSSSTETVLPNLDCANTRIKTRNSATMIFHWLPNSANKIVFYVISKTERGRMFSPKFNTNKLKGCDSRPQDRPERCPCLNYEKVNGFFRNFFFFFFFKAPSAIASLQLRPPLFIFKMPDFLQTDYLALPNEVTEKQRAFFHLFKAILTSVQGLAFHGAF